MILSKNIQKDKYEQNIDYLNGYEIILYTPILTEEEKEKRKKEVLLKWYRLFNKN